MQIRFYEIPLTKNSGHFFHFVLKSWTEGVGFVGPRDVKAHLMFPPLEGDLTVICGPPVFETAMIKLLDRIGFSSDQWFSFSANDKVSAKA